MMHIWKNLSGFTVIAFALGGIALASTSSTNAVSTDDDTYLAPLIKGCQPGERKCEVIEWHYLVTLREGYAPSDHLAHIAETIHVDPVVTWKMKMDFLEGGDYWIWNVSDESLHLLRQDPGVEQILEETWVFLPDELYVCRNPRLSEEERRICYEEEDLPVCERPSLTKEERQECFGANRYLSCIGSRPTEDEKRYCHEAYLVNPCDNPKLSSEQRRFCRDGSLVATSSNPLLSLFDEGRRTCAQRPETGETKIPVPAGL